MLLAGSGPSVWSKEKRKEEREETDRQTEIGRVREKEKKNSQQKIDRKGD